MISVVTDYAPCLAVRRQVFVEEQGISEAEEVDGRDPKAIHLLAMDQGKPVGAARILISGEIGKIGRICVVSEKRGSGLGAALVAAAVDHLRKQDNVTQAKLGSQDHAIGFYAGLGFRPIGPIYQDAGIPHQDMIRDL